MVRGIVSYAREIYHGGVSREGRAFFMEGEQDKKY